MEKTQGLQRMILFNKLFTNIKRVSFLELHQGLRVKKKIKQKKTKQSNKQQRHSQLDKFTYPWASNSIIWRDFIPTKTNKTLIIGRHLRADHNIWLEVWFPLYLNKKIMYMIKILFQIKTKEIQEQA